MASTASVIPNTGFDMAPALSSTASCREARHAVGPGRFTPEGITSGEPVFLDAEMRRVRETLELVGPASLSVLILGETGSGKEVAADWLHRASTRAQRNMLKINCAGLAESIVESELFGHEKGAFSGAALARQGLFEAADGGTLFLDEVAELTPRIQAKLLRVLECGEIIRVGSHTARRVDVRFVAATHRSLEQLVATGQFREDLYFRLNGVTVRLPPLRERREEILPLAHMFVRRAADKLGRIPLPLGEAAAEALLAHPWPGNVRELRQVIERAIVVCRSTALNVEDLGLKVPSRPTEPPTDREPCAAQDGAGEADEEVSLGLRDELRMFERDRIVAVLAQTNGNQTRAAQLLGVSRRTLTNKLNAYDIDRPRKER
jgi:DNA-binding NtrC family response regulator